MRSVAVVVLHFGNPNDTEECLKSLYKLQITNYKLQIIVVDNRSKEEFKVTAPRQSRRQVQGGELKVIRNRQNLGFAGGNNVGIRWALDNGADYILILNNDTVVHKNLIEELLTVAEGDERVGIVAPKIYFAKGFEFHRDRYTEEERGQVIWYTGGIMDWNNVVGIHRGVDRVDKGQYEGVEETDFASGCCMLVKREVFERVGLFDEKYFLYYEDSDLSERAKKASYKVVYASKARLWHKNAESAGGSGSALQDYYITRNRLLFGLRYAPLRAKLALVRESLVILGKGRAWQKRGIFDFFRRKFGKGSFPI